MKKNIIVLSLLSIILFTTAWAKGTTDTKVIVYYFLSSYRCSACYKIEQYTKEAIERYFSNELKSGQVVYKPVNIEKEENRHFIKEYQLYTKAVVISLVNSGKEIKHKNLTMIWQHLRDKDTFYDYIKSETNQFLEEASK